MVDSCSKTLYLPSKWDWDVLRDVWNQLCLITSSEPEHLNCEVHAELIRGRRAEGAATRSFVASRNASGWSIESLWRRNFRSQK